MSVVCSLFFFFKQKTAYEMRISDWSSDVCSSDLPAALGQGLRRRHHPLPDDPPGRQRQPAEAARVPRDRKAGRQRLERRDRQVLAVDQDRPGPPGLPRRDRRQPRRRYRPPAESADGGGGLARTDEHTSAIQSLLHNTPDVFYLKKQ